MKRRAFGWTVSARRWSRLILVLLPRVNLILHGGQSRGWLGSGRPIDEFEVLAKFGARQNAAQFQQLAGCRLDIVLHEKFAAGFGRQEGRGQRDIANIPSGQLELPGQEPELNITREWRTGRHEPRPD